MPEGFGTAGPVWLPLLLFGFLFLIAIVAMVIYLKPLDDELNQRLNKVREEFE